MKIIFFLIVINILSFNTYAVMRERNFSESDLSFLFKRITLKVAEAKYCISKGYDDPNQSLHEISEKELRSERGVPQLDQLWRWRADYKNLESIIVTEICSGRITTTDKAIEIGAGALTNGMSHLTSLLPKRLAQNIEKTDVNNCFVKTSSNLKHVDICQLEKCYSPASLDSILGSSVLDTLSDSDLIVACQQMYSTLKPGGTLIHFALLYPFLDTILTSLRSPDICFPWSEKNEFSGLRCISKENLAKNLSNRHRNFSPLEINFLNWYSDLTASEREFALKFMISRDGNTRNQFSQWIDNLALEEIKSIDNREFFVKRTLDALTNAGFEIDVAQLYRESQIKNKYNDAEEPNYFSCRFGAITKEKIYILAPNKAYYAVKMHVIIARKN